MTNGACYFLWTLIYMLQGLWMLITMINVSIYFTVSDNNKQFLLCIQLLGTTAALIKAEVPW